MSERIFFIIKIVIICLLVNLLFFTPMCYVFIEEKILLNETTFELEKIIYNETVCYDNIFKMKKGIKERNYNNFKLELDSISESSWSSSLNSSSSK